LKDYISIYFFRKRNALFSSPTVYGFALFAEMVLLVLLVNKSIINWSMLKILPTLIGMPWQSLLNLDEKKQIRYAMRINIILIPIIALGACCPVCSNKS